MLKPTIVLRDPKGIIARISAGDVLYTIIAPRYEPGSSPKENAIAGYTVVISFPGVCVTALVKSLPEAQAIAQAIFIGEHMDFDVLAVGGSPHE